MTYAADVLLEEAAYLSFHMHWSLGDVLDLEHTDRRRFLELLTTFAEQG